LDAQELYEVRLDQVWQRVEALPFVVCKASSGESFRVRHTKRSDDAEKTILRQLGFDESDLSAPVVETHQPWELQVHDVAGPEDWAKKRMEQGLGPHELSTFYDDDGPTTTLKARRKARLDAAKAAEPVKVPKWKGVFDRRGKNNNTKGTEKRKGVNSNVLNFLDGGAKEKEQKDGLVALALTPRPTSAERSAIYTAVLAANREACNEHSARSAHDEAKRAAREATDVYRNSMQHPGRNPVGTTFRLRLAVNDMHSERPFFLMPQLGRDRFVRASVAMEKVLVLEKPPWHIDHSIFAPRKAESDAKAYLDNRLVKTKRLATDWARACSKQKFKKVVMSADADASTEEDLKAELDEVRAAFERNYDTLFCGFNYFCMSGSDIGEDAYSLGFNQWSAFLADCEIPEPDSKLCRASDLDTAFIVTNFEEDKKSEMNQENDDRALMGFEFLEIIVRVAVAKYIKSGKCGDVSEAVEILCTECIAPNLCPEAVLIPNAFREQRLYFEEIAEVYEEHEDFLKALYQFYANYSGQKMMQMEGFILFCEQCALLGPKTGVSKREAKLIYAWSQMQVSDEIKKRQKLISLSFVDFLEALGRMAELISPPTEERLEEYFHATNPAGTLTPIWEYFQECPEEDAEETRRASTEFTAPKTRPLRVKIEGLLEMMVTQLKNNYGVKQAFDDPREMGGVFGNEPIPRESMNARQPRESESIGQAPRESQASSVAASIPGASSPTKPALRLSGSWSPPPELKAAIAKGSESGEEYTPDEIFNLCLKFHYKKEESMLTRKIQALAKTIRV